MMKVLIVDDEPKLREGLKTIVPWAELGYKVVDTAANGNEALEKHKRYAPDVMLVDIRMPGMDGLQLIEAIRSDDPAIHLLILSGYAEFDYARRAITQRVDGYLLKPVDEDELSGFLIQIKESIEQEQDDKALNQTVGGFNREQAIQSWIDQKTQKPVSRQLAEELGLVWNRYQVVLIHIHDLDEAESEAHRLFKSKLMECFEECFEDEGCAVVFTLHGFMGVLMPTPVLSVSDRETLKVRLDQAADLSGVSITAALGYQVHEISDITKSYEAAKRLLQRRFFYPSGKLLYPESVAFGEETEMKEVPGYHSEPFMERLYYAVDVGNVDVQKKVLRLAALAMIHEHFSEDDMKRAFTELLTGVYNKLIIHHTGLQSRTKEYSDRISAIFCQTTVFDLCHHCAQFLEELMWQTGSGGIDQEMKRMVDMIQRNYSENIKLKTLAEVFNYDRAYLGKMFKNITGENFTTYLDKVRIDKAKGFLKQGMKVYQVAERVGYTNVDYFHSKFKKYVGTSPSNYRKETGL
ncbi:response regulator transcription factor [Paenibacillus faecalis]|uniref:response regulator transcription factor n=1 Tax=Paenibacillus faecalis TaxID=2079532 RepID=UPI000D0FB766|nr:response regulator transcription factor [Paenibacillus faecalis]